MGLEGTPNSQNLESVPFSNQEIVHPRFDMAAMHAVEDSDLFSAEIASASLNLFRNLANKKVYDPDVMEGLIMPGATDGEI